MADDHSEARLVLDPWTQSQGELLDEFFAGDGARFLLWFDGMRIDVFDDLSAEYVEGDLTPVDNGAIGYTADWCDEHLRRSFNRRMGFFSPAPIYAYEYTEYDEREYFDVVPAADAYGETAVADRLDALGYRSDADGSADWRQQPRRTNAVVRDHLADLDGGIVRYIAPHPPLVGLEDVTSGRGKIDRVSDALETGELTTERLREAYTATARLAFDAAVDLIPDLPGEIAITADHGEALGQKCCESVFHSRTHNKCACLTVLPWFDVDEVVV